jgi:hypothetical protein
MKPLRDLWKACPVLFVFCTNVSASQDVDPAQIVASPQDYVGKSVRVKVLFNKIHNVYRGWEEEANLKQDRTIKFTARPLNEMACYADKTDGNEKILGGLRRGQEMVLTGHVKKCKVEARIKGERETVKRRIKGPAVYVFIVSEIESVGETPPPRFPGMRQRRRRGW